jgi:endonuclease/exonuclease/phosphatase family metal-dependent hydrolase
LLTLVPVAGLPPDTHCPPMPPTSLSVPFRFERPPENKSLTDLDAWCAAIGPVIVDANVTPADRSVPDATPPVTTDSPPSVAVVSWNVHGDAGDVAGLVRSIRQQDRRGSASSDLVLLLQEVVRRGDDVPDAVPPGARIADPLPRRSRSASGLRELAASLGMNLAYVPSMRNGRAREDRGNAVLSTLPFDRIDAFELPLGRQRRVGVAVTVRTGSPLRPQLRLVSVHFDTAVLPFRGGPAQWRRRQARAVIAALGVENVPTIVGGDLNTWWADDEPAVRELRRAYPEAVEPRRLARTWRGPAGTDNRLDYLFAGGWGEAVEVSRLRDRFGSDHHPLIARLRLPSER